MLGIQMCQVVSFFFSLLHEAATMAKSFLTAQKRRNSSNSSHWQDAYFELQKNRNAGKQHRHYNLKDFFS